MAITAVHLASYVSEKDGKCRKLDAREIVWNLSVSAGINVTCNIYPVLRYRKFILKCLSFIPISFIVFQDNTNTQNGNKNSWRWDETRAGFFFLQWKMVFLLCLSLFLWNFLAAVNLLTFLPQISLINIDACTCADGTTIIYLW